MEFHLSNTFDSQGAHSCVHCKDLVLDFGNCGNEEQIRRLRSIEWTSINSHPSNSCQENGGGEGHSLPEDLERVLAFRQWSDAELCAKLDWRRIFILDASPEDTEQKAKDGCKLYSTLLHVWNKHNDGHLTLYPNTSIDTTLALQFRNQELTLGYLSIEKKRRGMREYHLAIRHGTYLEVGVDDDSPLRSSFDIRPINLSPGSDSSLNQIASWLKVCRKGHSVCRSISRATMPFYALKISRPDWSLQLQLVQLTGACEYAALSYCWGQEETIVTTKAKLASHLVKIPLQSLPQTLKDAVLVTDSLGLQYLWIDALCIIQDDHEFKEVEIAKMANVYGNATVAIVASRASSVQEGFLHNRNPIADEFLKVHVINDISVDPTPVYLFEDALLWGRQNSPEPLGKRGWALQERLLSRRMIEFTTYQTRWLCRDRKTTFSDGCVVYDEWNSTSLLHRTQQRLWQVQSRTRKYGMFLRYIFTRRKMSRELLDEWFGLVKYYTERRLSKGTDKLPAFSAIAERYAMMSGDQYIAGLWKSAFSEGMSWTPEGVRSERIKQYQAPSWSWASVNSTITYTGCNYFYPDGPDPSFRIEEWCVDLASKGLKYGEVRSGVLTVKCHVAEARWIVDRRQDWEHIQPITSPGILEGRSISSDFWFIPDAKEAEMIAQDVELVTIFLIVIWVASGRLQGLALRPLPNDQFSRLGLFRLRDWKHEHEREWQWLLDAEIRTIEII